VYSSCGAAHDKDTYAATDALKTELKYSLKQKGFTRKPVKCPKETKPPWPGWFETPQDGRQTFCTEAPQYFLKLTDTTHMKILIYTWTITLILTSGVAMASPSFSSNGSDNAGNGQMTQNDTTRAENVSQQEKQNDSGQQKSEN
jgi:hypothetical protein